MLDFCASAGHVVVPFGGGSSVVGGVEPPEESDGVVSVDLTGLDKVIEVDTVSQAARIQGGTLGPALEAQLKPYGVTLRHFPQSFEFSTLGRLDRHPFRRSLCNQPHAHRRSRGVRSHGDACRSRTSPAGCPAAAPGLAPTGLAIGSEGILGIITEAWVRLHARPRFRAGAGVTFPSFEAACNAARSVVQSRMWPANCRVLDSLEARNLCGHGWIESPAGPWVRIGRYPARTRSRRGARIGQGRRGQRARRGSYGARREELSVAP